MNIPILLVVLITMIKMASCASPPNPPSIQSSIDDTACKSQEQNQSAIQLKSSKVDVSKETLPLNISLRLNPKKWANTPDAHLMITRIVPEGASTRQFGERDVGRLLGKIKKCIRRWSNVCNKTSLLYTAILLEGVTLSNNDNIVTFTGPVVGLLQYINDSVAKQLPSGWKVEGEGSRILPFVNIARSEREGVEAFFQEDDIQFAVFDFSTFILTFDGDEAFYHNSLN